MSAVSLDGDRLHSTLYSVPLLVTTDVCTLDGLWPNGGFGGRFLAGNPEATVRRRWIIMRL